MVEVIIVDDDQMVVFLHKIIIKDSSLAKNPVVAHDGNQALEYILQNKRSSDPFLLFLDINMPGMDGWQLMDELWKRKLQDQTKVVIVSSSIDEKDKRKARTYGNIIDYVEKPLATEYCKNLKEKLRVN